MTESAQALFAQAQKLRFESGDPEGALKLYRQIIADFSDSPEANYAAKQIHSMLAGPTTKLPKATHGITKKVETPKAHGGYETSRQIFKIISFAGWFLAAVGVLASIGEIVAAARGGSMIATLPGLVTAVSGLLIVATGQVSRAVVDMAEYNRDILAELRKPRK